MSVSHGMGYLVPPQAVVLEKEGGKVKPIPPQPPKNQRLFKVLHGPILVAEKGHRKIYQTDDLVELDDVDAKLFLARKHVEEV